MVLLGGRTVVTFIIYDPTCSFIAVSSIDGIFAVVEIKTEKIILEPRNLNSAVVNIKWINQSALTIITSDGEISNLEVLSTIAEQID